MTKLTSILIICFFSSFISKEDNKCIDMKKVEICSLKENEIQANISETELRENIINTAAKLLGTPYRRGGRNDNGFDCSGFVQHVMTENKVKISRSSSSQIFDGFQVDVQSVQPGDVLIFSGSRKSKHPGHAAIVHHIDEIGIIHFIHSASGKGITIDNLDQEYFKERFIAARNVITNNIPE